MFNNPLEIIASLLTLIAVLLNAKQSIWGWLFSILGTILYIYIFSEALILGDFLLNIYFLISSFYGFYAWKFKKIIDKSLEITRISTKKLFFLFLLAGINAIFLGKLFSTYPQANLPYLNGITTSFSIIGQWLLTQKKLENWLFWIITNIFAVGIYFMSNLWATAVLYFFLLLIAIKSFWEWKKIVCKKT